MAPAPIVPIIGGGPAGMSCALWLHNYGLRPVIIEQEAALGGMARHSPYPNEWLLGRPDETARENAAAFAGHIHELMIEARLLYRSAPPEALTALFPDQTYSPKITEMASAKQSVRIAGEAGM